MDHLPPPCLLHILDFVPPNTEYYVAMACSDWYAMFKEKRARRGDAKWLTSMCVCLKSIPFYNWARAHGLQLTWCLTEQIGAYGSIDVLKQARSEGCPWDARTATGAVVGNNPEMLKWAVSNGCPIDETTSSAVGPFSDALEILKWLREHGCPWDSRVFFAAVLFDNLEMLNWIDSKGAPWPTITKLTGLLHSNTELNDFVHLHAPLELFYNISWAEFNRFSGARPWGN